MKLRKTRKALRLVGLVLAVAVLVSVVPMMGLSASATKMEGANFTSGTPPFVYLVTGVASGADGENTAKLYQDSRMGADYATYTGTYTIPARAYDREDMLFYTVTEVAGQDAASLGALQNVPLTGIVLPNTLTKIGARAFADSGLREITFPTSVTSLAADAFSGTAISKLTLDVAVNTTLVGNRSYDTTAGLITLPADITQLNITAPLVVTGPVEVKGNATVTNTSITVNAGSLTLDGALAGQGVVEVRNGGSFTIKGASPAFTGSIRLTSEDATFTNESPAAILAQNTIGTTLTVRPGMSLRGGDQRAVDPANPQSGEAAEMPEITANAGGTVTMDDTGTILTIMPNQGFKIQNVVVNGQNMGNISRYVFGVASAQNTVAVTFTEGEQEPEGPDEPVLPPTYFIDVPATAIYAESVSFLANNGIVYGMGNNIFAPDMLTTRAMMVCLLKHMEVYGGSFSVETQKDAGIEEPEKKSWWTDAMIWAASNGMINPNIEVFEPHKLVTREELAVLLARFTWLRGFSTRVDASRYNSYRDSVLLSGESRDAMVWAVSKGYLLSANSVLDPSGTITRSDMAILLAKYLRAN